MLLVREFRAISIGPSTPTNRFRLLNVTNQFTRIFGWFHAQVSSILRKQPVRYATWFFFWPFHINDRDIRYVGPWTHFSMVTTVRNSNQRFQPFIWTLRIKCKFISEMENISEFSIYCSGIPISRHQIDSSEKFYFNLCHKGKSFEKSVCHFKVDAHRWTSILLGVCCCWSLKMLFTQ